ncbi:hypothetical protein GOP47_0020322 [Adiantum capillus-veneris]|uniref:Pentatricopeptide repeat-containing protein n=1 Tax=Adiantum capillus-veneris TaxID=13818 RepID=A0A9D4UD99_ADICA|nr:hypothetical protein GOP47_0020322 [Adiantum capillus-veneris]
MGRWAPRRKRSLGPLHLRPTSAPSATHQQQNQIWDVKGRTSLPCMKCIFLSLKRSGWAKRCILSEHHDHHHLSCHFEAPRAHHAALADFDSSQVQEGLCVGKRLSACSSRWPSLPVDSRLSLQVYTSSTEVQGAVETLHSREIKGTHQPLEGARHEFSGSHSSKGGVRSELLRIHSTCQEGHLDKALCLLSSYKRALPTSIYVSLLKLCSKKKALNQAKQVHAHLVRNSVPITGFIGDFLLMSLAKCSAVEDVYQIFATLPQHTVFSWTAIISAKVDAGYGQEALEMSQLMQKEGIEPNTYTFVSLFKACGITQNLPKGQELHEFARRRGLLSDPFVLGAIVSFYSKCGSIISAENVFSSSLQTNIVTWNAMLAAYVEHEAGIKALKLYRQMQQEGVSADQLTYVLILQACGVLAEKGEALSIDRGLSARAFILHIGRAIHSDSQRSAPGPFVNNALVVMYGKCGAIVEAEHVFGALSDRNIATWNSMLAAYLQKGECEKVLLMYRQLQQTGIGPSERTLVFAVQACGGLAEKEESLIVEGQPVKMSALSIGEGLQMDAHRNNFGCSTFVGTSLLSMYGKGGAVSKAEAIFVALSYRDSVAWNALLSIYVDQSCGLKALKLYRQMHEEGLIADEVALMLAVQACGILLDKERTSVEEIKITRVCSLEIGKSLHADARKNGFSLDVYLGSTLISMYTKLGAVSNAENVFLKLPHSDVVLWSTMISAYVEQGQGELALILCQHMLREGVSMDPRALVYALQACASLAEKGNAVAMKEMSTKSMALEIGRALHAEARSKDFLSFPHVGIALINMYGKCGALDEAKDSFGTWSGGNTVIWNAMFSTYLEHGHYQNVLSLYSRMQKQRLVLDDATILCILQTCSLVGSLEICNQIHFVSASTGWDQVLSVAASINHAYGNCVRMEDAKAISDQLARPDLVLWNACCDGFAGIGDFSACFSVIENSELTGTKPDDITFVLALSVCSRTGYIHEGLECFDRMTQDYDIVVGTKHLGKLVDLLGRAGNFRMIENILRRMAMLESFTMCLSLLAFCSVHGNIELARRVFEHAVKLEPKDSTAYIAMSNIYIDPGLHGNAAEIERLQQDSGAFKSLLND